MKLIEGIFYLSFFVVMLVFIFPVIYNGILDMGFTSGIGLFLKDAFPYVFIGVCILVPLAYFMKVNNK